MSKAKELHARWLTTRNRAQESADYRDEWWAEQCGMCQHWTPLSGKLGLDYGACTAEASAFDGCMRFEHDGCEEHLAAKSWCQPYSTEKGEVTNSAANESGAVTVTLPADVNQVDDTGWVWAFLSDAPEPERIRPGAIIVAGDAVEPVLARVVDVIDRPGDEKIVHLDVIGGPQQTIDELRHAGLL